MPQHQNSARDSNDKIITQRGLQDPYAILKLTAKEERRSCRRPIEHKARLRVDIYRVFLLFGFLHRAPTAKL